MLISCQQIEGKSILVLLKHSNKQIPWCEAAVMKCRQHIVRHRLTPKNVKYLYFWELLVSLNANIMDVNFVLAVFHRLQRKLENLCNNMIRDGLARWVGSDTVEYTPWVVNRWLAEEWNGDANPMEGDVLFER